MLCNAESTIYINIIQVERLCLPFASKITLLRLKRKILGTPCITTTLPPISFTSIQSWNLISNSN